MCGAGNQNFELVPSGHCNYTHWHSKCLNNAQQKSSVHCSGMIELNLGLYDSVSNNFDFRRCALTILGRAQNVMDAQGGHIEDWYISGRFGSKCNPH